MLVRKPNVLQEKSEAFASRIIKMTRYLRSKNVDTYLVNQVARSGTSIGANISESRCAQSRADFVSKLSIALKEADETKFWLKQLKGCDAINDSEYNSITSDLMEIIYLLNSIIKTTKENGL
ncbi:MAG: four helix bundle protein [Prevotella sp.]|nr:four helix bundle protein [Prevotella sp.]